MKLISIIIFIIALKCVSTNRNQGSDDQWCAESYMKNPDCLNGGDCKFEVNNMYESNPNGNINSLIKTFLFIEK